MTARYIAHRLLRRDIKSTGPGFLHYREFEQIAMALIGQPFDRDKLIDLGARNAETDGAFLSDDEAACVLHIANGGNLDDVVGDNQFLRTV